MIVINNYNLTTFQIYVRSMFSSYLVTNYCRCTGVSFSPFGSDYLSHSLENGRYQSAVLTPR